MENSKPTQASATKSKWFTDLGPETPATEAAVTVLAERLEAVDDFVKRIRRCSEDDPSHVHRLRVATRRASAVLAAFEPVIKDTQRKEVRKRLRGIRRAAGAVRMCDVHLEIVRGLAADRPELRSAIGLAAVQIGCDRDQALSELASLAARCKGKDVRPPRLKRRAADDSVAPVRLSDVAVEALARSAGKFQDVGRGDLQSQEALHGLRRRGKQLRYAIEIFAQCIAEHPRKYFYTCLESLQEHLGALNDWHELTDRLNGYAKRLRNALGTAAGPKSSDDDDLAVQVEALAEEFRQRYEEGHAAFLAWWNGPEAQEFHLMLDRLADHQPLSDAALSASESAESVNGEAAHQDMEIVVEPKSREVAHPAGERLPS